MKKQLVIMFLFITAICNAHDIFPVRRDIPPTSMEINGPLHVNSGDVGVQFTVHTNAVVIFILEIEEGPIEIVNTEVVYSDRGTTATYTLNIGSDFLRGELHFIASNYYGSIDEYFMIWSYL